MPADLKSTVRRFYDEINAGNHGVIDELIADDMVEHEEFPGLEPTKDGVRQFFAMFRSAFPDFRMEPQQLIADGDLVCARVAMTGTHQGEFMGIPPSGRRIDVQLVDIIRVRDGEFAEHWGVMDSMTMMQQLGAVPEQAPA